MQPRWGGHISFCGFWALIVFNSEILFRSQGHTLGAACSWPLHWIQFAGRALGCPVSKGPRKGKKQECPGASTNFPCISDNPEIHLYAPLPWASAPKHWTGLITYFSFHCTGFSGCLGFSPTSLSSPFPFALPPHPVIRRRRSRSLSLSFPGSYSSLGGAGLAFSPPLQLVVLKKGKKKITGPSRGPLKLGPSSTKI